MPDYLFLTLIRFFVSGFIFTLLTCLCVIIYDFFLRHNFGMAIYKNMRASVLGLHNFVLREWYMLFLHKLDILFVYFHTTLLQLYVYIRVTWQMANIFNHISLLVLLSSLEQILFSAFLFSGAFTF